MDNKIKLVKKFIIVGVFLALIGFMTCFSVLGYAFFTINSTIQLPFEFNPFIVFFIGMILAFLGVLSIKLPILFYGISLKKSDVKGFFNDFNQK